MPLKVIDIETTGTDPKTDRIIEIASIDLGAGGIYVNPVETLVNPERDIPPQSSAVHGMVAEDVAGAPLLAAALPLFKAPAMTYVAHNCAFERSFLEPHGLEGQWVCTMKCALRVWGDDPAFPGAGNQALRYWLGILEPFGVPRAEIVPHRAMGDVLVTGAILFKLLEQAKFADLLAWSAEPARYPVLTFGKHRGTRVTQAPGDYLEWLATGRHDMEEDWRHTAKCEIERRRAA